MPRTKVALSQVAEQTNYVRVRNSEDQGLSSNTWLTLTFDTEDWDGNGLHSTGSNTSRLTAIVAGFYLISFSCLFSGGGTNTLVGARFKKNGSSFIAYVTSETRSDTFYSIGAGIELTTLFYLSANEYVEVEVVTSASGLSVKGGAPENVSFAMVKVAG
jgi:hypothetical protein